MNELPVVLITSFENGIRIGKGEILYIASDYNDALDNARSIANELMNMPHQVRDKDIIFFEGYIKPEIGKSLPSNQYNQYDEMRVAKHILIAYLDLYAILNYTLRLNPTAYLKHSMINIYHRE